MTPEGWRRAILMAVANHEAGDDSMLDGLAMALHESDRAKQRLHEAGCGCTGVGILDSAATAADMIADLLGGRVGP